MVWKITEAEGTYATRCRSGGVRRAADGAKRQHEHVFTRADLIDQVMSGAPRPSGSGCGPNPHLGASGTPD